jgi:coproporphyrinogen III oxidase-like Fe-S oxidoreductase
VQREERLMLGLRLDEPLPLAGVAEEIDLAALERLERLGLAQRVSVGAGAEALTLTDRGRLVGDGVTADLVA